MSRQELRAYWQQKIEEQKQSGINIAAWCRKNSLNNKTFRRWKRNLKSTSSAVPEGWNQGPVPEFRTAWKAKDNPRMDVEKHQTTEGNP